MSEDPHDTCHCGDYRFQHVDGTGRCKLNELGHGYSGGSCSRFRLAKTVQPPTRHEWRSPSPNGGAE